MRKLLLLLVCALVSIGTWADSMGSNGSTYTVETTTRNSLKKLTINLTTAGDLASAISNELNSVKGQANCVVITGPVNADDLKKLDQFPAELLDISGVEYSGTLSNNISVKQGGQGVVIPSSWSLSEYFGVDSYKHSVVFQKDGTELNAYVRNDNNDYQSSGLVDIMSHDKYDYDVFDGMTAFSIHEYKAYGSGIQSTTTVNADIVNAMNSTNYDIKTINLENGKANNLSISIQNGHIETLNLSGLQMTNGTTLNIGGEMKDDMALKNLNLSNVKVGNVDATNLETLEAINLKGANLTNIDITQTDGDYSGIVISVDDPALEGKITPAPSSIWGEDVAEHIITDRSLTDNDGCSITPNEDGTVATVHAVTPGHFKALFLQYKDKFGDGVTFKFDSECNLNADDLAILAGEIDQYNNNTNRNKYYVDLYDVPTEGTNIETAITGAIGQMRTNNWQYKGLLLPKNPTTVGTTLIQDRAEDATKLATCSQFIAYNNGATTVAHVYNATNTTTAAYNSNVAALESVLELHSEIGTNTTTYLVTTNSTSKISLTALPSTATRVETINNDMVNPNPDSPAKMYVYPSESGKFDELVDNTGVAGTAHLELLEINDAANPYDFTAINDFTGGPRVLDLRNITSPITKAMLESLTNSHIEFILLPESMANKEDVCEVNYSASMTSLKAVIASTSTTLAAHVAQAGSLAEARSLVTGGSVTNGILYPTKTGLTSVTLSGSLNAADITQQINSGAPTPYIDANGHWSSTNAPTPAFGLNQETSITSFDLENAVFADQHDMNFNYAGYENLTSVILPTSTAMNTIPAHCLDNISTLQELCIPYNYEIIEDGALWGTNVKRLTTTDANGAVVDNGDLTWTLSANLKQLGITPNPVTNGITCPIFPQNNGVLEVYSLATKAPKCYKNTFPANACDGWGGTLTGVPYSRDRYFNGTNANQSFAVLRFPSEESYNAVSNADMKDVNYQTMKERYTDVTKVFTKLDQTGGVDANGDPITWPTLEEIYRTFNQASLGVTWDAWKVSYTNTTEQVNGVTVITPQVNGGQPKVSFASGVYSKSDVPGAPEAGDDNYGKYTYTFDEYAGWHQIVLSQATYVEPTETVVDDEIIREYQDAGWYTLCLPFNLSIKQVREWLGVPKSEGNVVCKLYDANGDLVSDNVTSPLMPDIRQLFAVERTKGGTTKDKQGNTISQNMVYLRTTKNLWDGSKAQYLEFYLDAAPAQVIKYTDAHTSGTTTVDDDNCLIGGRPYIIRAYKRKGETISRQNIGQMIMTRYADMLDAAASCVMNGEYEQLGSGNLLTLRFAKPYENHKVQAVNGNPEASGYMEYTDADDNTTKRYFYTMIGQFWTQPLPQYCLYMSRGSWYRYTNTSLGYTWDPYKCVIMATVEKDDSDHPKSGGYRDNSDGASVYPQPKAGTTDQLEDSFKLQFLDGRDDDDFKNYAQSKYIFVFDDDGVTEFDNNGMVVSAIESLDGESLSAGADSKVYNISGQYVGNSRDGLSKGMYIVNGKKFVVK